MKKIPTLFVRDTVHRNLVTDEVNPGCLWVLKGKGVATRKWDGTCCLVRDGVLYKRYELKNGKSAPAGFEAAQDADLITGKTPGWVPVGDGPEDRWHREAWNQSLTVHRDGTYELCGPKVNGNPEELLSYTLIRHGEEVIPDAPRFHEDLRAYLMYHHIEGIVWHHPDGRMAKIKARDFGISWPNPGAGGEA